MLSIKGKKNHNFLYNSQICLNIYKLQNILQNNKKNYQLKREFFYIVQKFWLCTLIQMFK